MTDFQLSRRAQHLTGSSIREILKVTERPEVISFAGGLPSPATFPNEHLREACDRVLAENPADALQYGPTEGYVPLRRWVAERFAQKGVAIDQDRVLITTGSQQGLDLLGKCLIDEESKALVETPTYLGALQALSLYRPQFRPLPSDCSGIDTNALSVELLSGGRLLYCLPNFQNPTGRCLPLERRQSLVEQAAEAGVPLIEDDPYGELSYDGETLPSLLSFNPAAGIYLGSFSKILAPGLRLGYVVAPRQLHNKLVQAKQAADLHTPSFNQRIVYEVIKDGFLDDHIPTVRKLYGHQCRLMLSALDRHFPSGASWTHPKGGMFIWVTLPESIDSAGLLAKALDRNVAFVPGGPFYFERAQTNTLRLSFVTVPEGRINDGVRIIGELIGEELNAQTVKSGGRDS